MVSGFPALPIPTIKPFFTPISAYVSVMTAHLLSAHLVDTAPIDNKGVGDDEIEHLRVLST